MNRSTLARTAFAAVAAAGILASAACGNSTNDAITEATESAAALASSAMESAQSAASEAQQSAAAAATEAADAAQSAASGASEAAESAISGDTVEVPLADGSTAAISTAASQLYEQNGGATGALGTVEGPTEAVGDGSVTPFSGGSIYTSSLGTFSVQGDLERIYQENGGPTGALGFPIAGETTLPDGWQATFQNGAITWTGTDGNYVPNVITN